MTPRSRVRQPVHPGEILNEELLARLGMSVNQLARALHVPANRLGQIVNRRRGITPDTSLRLSRYFGFSPEYWFHLQAHYDLELPARLDAAHRGRGEAAPRPESRALKKRELLSWQTLRARRHAPPALLSCIMLPGRST